MTSFHPSVPGEPKALGSGAGADLVAGDLGIPHLSSYRCAPNPWGVWSECGWWLGALASPCKSSDESQGGEEVPSRVQS